MVFPNLPAGAESQPARSASRSASQLTGQLGAFGNRGNSIIFRCFGIS